MVRKNVVKRCLLLVFLLSVPLLLIACGRAKTEEADGQENIKQFLSLVYTTDADGRYLAYLEAETEVADEMSLTEAMADYYAGFEQITEEELLDKLKANRIPLKYDALYASDPVTVDAVTLTFDEKNQKYAYTVSAHNGGGELSYAGEIAVNAENQISYFYEG